jgi:transposase
LVPTNLLNLPQYRVLRVDETEHDYHVTVEPVESTQSCRYCQSPRFTAWGSRNQMFHDLPMHGKRVGIYVDTRRFKCLACTEAKGKPVTFSQILPALSDNRMMTDRLAKWMGPQALKRTFISIADETGVTEGTVRNVFADYVAELEKQFKFEAPKVIGIDEIHIIKRPRAVISNIHASTLIDMLPDRNKKTVATYLSRLPGREHVQHVAIDMWAPYRDAVQSVLPQARVVVDKFHVLRMGNEAMAATRKALRDTLSDKERRGLMHDRFVLLKRRHSLTAEEYLTLSGWISNYPLLGEAYSLKEAYFAIYDAPNKIAAYSAYTSWAQSIPPELAEYWKPITTAWGNWMPEILEYFEHRITNALTESLNSVLRALERAGRGYSFDVLRAKILFAERAHKQSRPKFSRQPVPQHAPRMSGLIDRFDSMPVIIKRGVMLSENLLDAETRNLGVDITKLLELVESGEF